jgi:hypothetical protein
MSRVLKAVAGAAILASLTSSYAADITGKVTLKGEPPKEVPLPLASDPGCGRLRQNEKPTTRFYVVGEDKGLAEVFVYLRSANLKSETPSKPALLDQVGCEYVPHVSGLQTGQKLLIRNSDPVFHNVHAIPRINAQFNLAQTAGAKDIERVFDKPEVFVRFKCDVHAWMYAYVGVLPHSYYAVTDKDGNFKIENVPAGEYELVAFHRKSHVTEDKAITQKVTVGDQPVVANFTVEVPTQ